MQILKQQKSNNRTRENIRKEHSEYLEISLSPFTSGLKRTMALRQPSSVLSIVISCIFVTNSTSTLSRKRSCHIQFKGFPNVCRSCLDLAYRIAKMYTTLHCTGVTSYGKNILVENEPVQNFSDPRCVCVLPRDNDPTCKLYPCKMSNWSQVPGMI